MTSIRPWGKSSNVWSAATRHSDAILVSSAASRVKPSSDETQIARWFALEEEEKEECDRDSGN